MEKSDGPLDILKLALETQVQVTLKDLSLAEGKLKGFDEHLNIFLGNCNSSGQHHDVLFIRGDLVKFVRPLTYIS